MNQRSQPDVHIILEQGRVALDKLRHHCGAGTEGRGVIKIVKVDIVHALGDVSDPGRLLLLGRSHQVQRHLCPSLHRVNLELEVEAVVVGPGPREAARGRAEVTDAAGATHTRAKRRL